MKADKAVAAYKKMRLGPLWRLLAADKGPTVIGVLQSLLFDSDRILPASVFYERLEQELESLRDQNEDFPLPARTYASHWLNDGYLERSFPVGAAEEQFELSASAIDAIRFVSGLMEPHSAATESRLSVVIDALVRLSKETDTDKERRIAALQEEKDRIDKQISAIQQGQMRVLPHELALERMQEIVILTEGLTGDFRKVRDRFAELNRDIREKLLDSEGRRGEILFALFEGVDLIFDSPAGRSFDAFWRLLTDREQSAALDQAIEGIVNREFFSRIDPKSRRLMLRLTRTLLEESATVQETSRSFSANLRQFVQSRQYLEHRRMTSLLKDAQRSALEAKERVKLTDEFMTLTLTSSLTRSHSQFAVLYQPDMHAPGAAMADGTALLCDLEALERMVNQSEINFEQLRNIIRTVLMTRVQASIGQILEEFPATQGLGTVVGLLVLARRGKTAYGLKSPTNMKSSPVEIPGADELVSWIGEDHVSRSARIPVYYFVRERLNELSR